MFGNKPDRLVGSHPMKTIEPCQIYRAGIAPQCALESEIEVNVEIAHRQLAQRPINRLTIAAPSEIGFRDRAPMTTHFKNRDYVISVLLRFQIENERRKSEDAQGGRCKNSTFKAGRGPLLQNLFRRTRRVTDIVGDLIEEFLNAGRRF